MSRHGGSGGAETGGDTRFRGEASRIDSRGHQLRKSSRRKEQRRAIHVTLPNCGTGVQNPLTLPYVSQLHGTKQRPVLLSSSSSSSFPFSLSRPSFSLQPFLPFFSPLSWLSPSTGVPLPRYSPANKTVSKICVRKYALKRDEFPPVPRSKGESRDRNFNGRVSTPRSGVQGAYTRMRRDSWEKTAGYASSMLVDRIIRAVFRLDRILSNQMERELVSSGVSENIIAGEGGSYRRILKKKRVRLIRSECSLHSL